MFKSLIVVLLLTVAVTEAQLFPRVPQVLRDAWKNVVNPINRLSDITVKVA